MNGESAGQKLAAPVETKLSSVQAAEAAINLRWDVTLQKYGPCVEGQSRTYLGEEILTLEVEMDLRGMLREMAGTLQHSKSKITRRWRGLAKARLVRRRAK